MKMPLFVEETLLALGVGALVLTATFFMEVANVYAEELKPRMVATQPANGGRTGFVITPDGKHTVATFADGTVVTNAIQRIAQTPTNAVYLITERLNERLVIDAARAQAGGDLQRAANDAKTILQAREEPLPVLDGGELRRQ